MFLPQYSKNKNKKKTHVYIYFYFSKKKNEIPTKKPSKYAYRGGGKVKDC